MQLVDRMSHNLRGALKHAITLATRQGYSTVYPEHLLLGLAAQRGSIASELMKKYKFNRKAETEYVLRRKKHKTLKPTPAFAKESRQAIERSVVIATQYKHHAIGTEHLLLAMLESNNAAIARAVKATKMKHLAELASYVHMILKSSSKLYDMQASLSDDSAEKSSTSAPGPIPGMQPVGTPAKLEHFVRDLTNEEEQKHIDPVIGRDTEIERLIHILCRKTKNNPLLLGDPGVGKTAIVEGLAKRIVEGDVPPALHNKRIMALDIGLLISGTMYRGEFESRLKTVMEELKRDKNAILFIDEIHTIVGAGATNGSLDAANLLKPALARGHLRCIGATTFSEYKKHIEHDPALDRRFGKIMVNEPSTAKTLEILRGLKPSYEDFHNVHITDEALQTAIDTAVRYLPESHFPDKAIDLLDEAAAAITAQTPAHPLDSKIAEVEESLLHNRHEKQKAVAQENFERAMQLKEYEVRLEKTLAKLKKRKTSAKRNATTITAEDIAHVVSKRTGRPHKTIIGDRRTELGSIAKHIDKHILGQDIARQNIHTALRKGLLGLHVRKRPMASLLFVGPSGTGKTHSAQVIAEAVYGDPKALISLDMSEFKEGYAISKLIGSPAGYVGYRDTTSFSDRLRRQPFSVLLLDEFDAAHPDVQNLFMQILDTGVITDATGKTIDCSHTTIIFTTSAGADKLSRGSIGFGEGSVTTNDQVRAHLKTIVRSELLNRIDTIAHFQKLDQKTCTAIARKALKQYVTQLKKQGMDVTMHTSVANWIGKHAASSPQLGRTVYTMIENEVLPVLTDGLAETTTSEGSVTVKRVNNTVALV